MMPTDTQGRWYPPGSTKMVAKAVAVTVYLFSTSRQDLPGAICYVGKATKPTWHFRFRSDKERAQRIADTISSVKARNEYREARKAERKEAGRGLEVGDVLRASWGYDQTNIDFYQVTGLIGKTMVEIREIAQMREETAWAQGKCVPALDNFVGEPMRRVARNGSVKVDSVSSAYKVEPKNVGGVKVYDASHWTAYH